MMASGFTMVPTTGSSRAGRQTKTAQKFESGGYVKSPQERMDDSLAKSDINFQQSKLLKKALKEQKGK